MPHQHELHLIYHLHGDISAKVFEKNQCLDDILIADEAALPPFLEKHQQARLLTVFVPQNSLELTEAVVPISFTSDDILVFIQMEQAKLFPMLDEDIYMDFRFIEKEDHEKTITILACNTSRFADLHNLIKTFSIQWISLKSLDKHHDTLNLLPWRQALKHAQQKKYRRILLTSIITITLLSFSISLYLASLRQAYEKYNTNLNKTITQKIKPLITLEKLKQSYQEKLSLWQTYHKIAQSDAHLENLLISIELSRPEGLILKKVHYVGKSLYLQAKAKNENQIKSYLAALQKIHHKTSLLSLNHNIDQTMDAEIKIYL